MNEVDFDAFKNWLLYREFPEYIRAREDKKTFKKKLKKFKYDENTDLLYYHINNKVDNNFYYTITLYLYS